VEYPGSVNESVKGEIENIARKLTVRSNGKRSLSPVRSGPKKKSDVPTADKRVGCRSRSRNRGRGYGVVPVTAHENENQKQYYEFGQDFA
jgi:hypothetical protein